MIQFFRKIRQQLVTENKTGRYLKYAIGEIFLVVIGILIAVQINNWNENRKDRNAEQALYQTLINSLESDLEDANDKIASVDQSIKAQELFILNSFEEIKEKFDLDQIEKLLLAVGKSSRSFFPNYGLYDKISANNQIDLIQSSDLQMKIIELYEQYYKRYNDLDLNMEHQAMFSLYNHYFSKIEDVAIRNEGRYKVDFETLERYYDVLRDECRKIHSMTDTTHSSMIQCKEEIESLLALVRNEVK
jgi:Family of unknown function (DUF6090)